MHRLLIAIVFISFFALPLQQASALNVDTQSALRFVETKDWDAALAFARKSGNPLLVEVVQWHRLRDTKSGASFQEIAAFLARHADWPESDRLRLRAEQALRENPPEDALIIKWFDAQPPVSGIGKLALAEALARQAPNDNVQRVDYLIRDAWRNGDFSENEEITLLTQYGSFIKTKDHESRADRLLWEAKTAPVLRMLPLLNNDDKAEALARIALIENKSNAEKMAASLPPKIRSSPGVTYERLRWNSKQGNDAQTQELLLATPEVVPYPQKWWKLREAAVRAAVDDNNADLGLKLLARHGQTEGSELVDALWLKGWLLLEFKNQPQEAYAQFTAMFRQANYPVSKARAAYWASRAARNASDKEAAKTWAETASSYPSNFYGQVASAALRGTAPLRIPADLAFSPERYAVFEKKDTVRALYLLARNNMQGSARIFMNHLIDQAKSDADALMVATLAARMDQSFGVRAAKRALQGNMLLLRTGYPQPSFKNLSVEPALALGLMRQESEFDARAKSPSGALGLMQLLPSTAKETARKADMIYTETRLYEPAYNAELGSLYLQKLITLYDGSYIKAIAAYNGGMGNVRKWSGRFGNPGNDMDSAINWIEKIPFAETRNYVQRVLENTQIYRYVLANGTPQLIIEKDLTR